MTDSIGAQLSTPEKRHRAARVIAGHAVDGQDLHELLDMLGLSPREGRAPVPETVPARRHARRTLTVAELTEFFAAEAGRATGQHPRRDCGQRRLRRAPRTAHSGPLIPPETATGS